MRDVFVSSPSALADYQEQFREEIERILKERDLRPRTLGKTDYPNIAPIGAVAEVMNGCHGAVILGLKQMRVIEGLAKEGTEEEKQIENHFLPTPWNHIEAGMAFGLKLPVLIIRERGIQEGVFEPSNSDRFIHEVALPEQGWLTSDNFLQPLNNWLEEIIKSPTSGR